MNSEPSGVNWAGDWVLVWEETAEPGPGRNAAAGWQCIAQQPTWTLWQQPSNVVWQGFPYQTGQGEGWRYWLMGEIYGVKSSSQPTFLLDVVTGRVKADQLNGHFLLCAWQETTNQWHIWTDRFGTLHGYYAQDGRRAALGTYSGAVSAAASRRRLDWPGLSSFFACGFFLQDRTQYEDVRILRPASHLVLDEKGQLCHQEQTWEWTHEPDTRRSYQDTVAEFAHHFQTVMAEQLAKDRIAVPISGGLDSRSTVATVDEERSRIWAYSYGYTPNSVETKIARRIAQARQLPFQSFTIPPYLFDRLPQVTGAVEGFQDVTQCRQAAILPQLAEQAEFVMAAHWGDVWLDDMGLVEQPNLTPDAFLAYAWKKMAKKGRDWLLAHLCEPQLGTAAPEKQVQAMLAEELGSVNHLAEPDFRLKAFKTRQWSARWTTASIRMYQPAAFPRLPFYDTRLADFFITVPSAYVAHRQLQVDYLKQFAPDLARIPWQVYQANLYQYPYFTTWLLPVRAARKLWRTVSGQKVIERNWEVQFLNPAGEQGLVNWLLRSGLPLHEYLSPTLIQDLLVRFRAEPVAYGYAVSMLLTFSAWLESQ